MKILIVLGIALGLFIAATLPSALAAFVGLTFCSMFLLACMPAFCKGHVAKVGTYTHEISHGVVSLLSGGEFREFRVGARGGISMTAGGNRKLVTSAGYVGTILLGAVFLCQSAAQDMLAAVLYVVAIGFALSTLKAGDIHTAAIGNITALVLGLTCLFYPDSWPARFMLNLLGIILVWQGIEAVCALYKVSGSTGSGSDAEVMSSLAGRSPRHWAVVFGGLGLVILVVALAVAVRTAVAG